MNALLGFLDNLTKGQKALGAMISLVSVGFTLATVISTAQIAVNRETSQLARDSANVAVALARTNADVIARLDATVRAEFDRTNCIVTLTEDVKRRIATNPQVLDRECPPVRR